MEHVLARTLIPSGRGRNLVAMPLAALTIVAVAMSFMVSPRRVVPETGRLSLGRVGAIVPRGFVGFSIEYPLLGRFLGLPGEPANPLFAQTLRALASGDPPQLRIGGNSADVTWPAGWPAPPSSVRYAVTPAWFARLAALLRATGSRVVLTANLGAARPDAAAELLRRAHATLPSGSIASVAIGNEPDRYAIPTTRIHGDHATTLRAPGYSFRNFLSDERATLSALRATGIPFALTGPGFAGPRWNRSARRLLRARLGLSSYGAHLYALSGCGPARRRRESTQLLSTAATAGALRTRRAAFAAARAAHVPLDIQEGNSVSCSGKRGVSDHPYSALWAPGMLFDAARVGASHFHFHLSGGAYDPFGFRWTGDRWQVHFAPEALGILLFDHATAPGARVVNVAGAPRGVSAWATRDPLGVTRLLIVNRSTGRPARLAVPGVTARLLQLTTAGGVRIDGRPVAAWQNGPGVYQPTHERAVLGRHGRITLTLPAASADVLDLGVSAG